MILLEDVANVILSYLLKTENCGADKWSKQLKFLPTFTVLDLVSTEKTKTLNLIFNHWLSAKMSAR